VKIPPPRGIALTLALLGSLSVSASTQTAPDLGTFRIRAIEIVTYDVFDQPVAGWSAPYDAANRIHTTTREGVIRRELLFASGDVLNPVQLEQTERNLRALRFLRDARIEWIPVGEENDGEPDGRQPEAGQPVDVRVEVWDVWSLVANVQLAQIDDQTVWSAGVSEKNLLGWGKEVSVSHSVTLDRSADRFWYRDPQVAGSRLRLTAAVADLSDGDEGLLAVGRPFYSLDDTWAFAVQASTFTRSDPLFEGGEETIRLRHLATWGDVEVARAVRRREDSALRLHTAYRVRDDRVAGARRNFRLLEVGLTSVSHRFVQLTHVGRFQRTQDINLGAQWHATIGLSTPTLGGGEDRVLFLGAGHSRTLAFASTHFVTGSIGASARRESEGWANAIGEVRVLYLRQHATRHTLLGKVDLRLGHNLDPEVQLLLGAESGFRGYPVRQFQGTRSLLFSVEERWFIADDLVQLLSVGVAGFVESGFAWPDGLPVRLADLKTDIGGSLLLGSPRLSAGPGVRLNLAYALDPLPFTDRWVFSAISTIDF